MTYAHDITDATVAAGRGAGDATPGLVVAERDDRRQTLIVHFNVWPVAAGATVPPSNPKELVALLYLDDGDGVAVTPSWDRHTYSLAAGQTLTISRQTPPLPTSRVTAALSVVAGTLPADFRIRLTVAEYRDPACAAGA